MQLAVISDRTNYSHRVIRFCRAREISLGASCSYSAEETEERKREGERENEQRKREWARGATSAKSRRVRAARAARGKELKTAGAARGLLQRVVYARDHRGAREEMGWDGLLQLYPPAAGARVPVAPAIANLLHLLSRSVPLHHLSFCSPRELSISHCITFGRTRRHLISLSSYPSVYSASRRRTAGRSRSILFFRGYWLFNLSLTIPRRGPPRARIYPSTLPYDGYEW